MAPLAPHPHTPPPHPTTTPQDILEDGHGATDASGNPILKDIGLYLKSEFKRHFKGDNQVGRGHRGR
jgi:hypothetical protein